MKWRVDPPPPPSHAPIGGGDARHGATRLSAAGLAQVAAAHGAAALGLEQHHELCARVCRVRPRAPAGATKRIQRTRKVCSCIHLKCLRILYWVLG